MAGDNLLNLSLAAGSASFRSSIGDTCVNRGDCINNNLILILRVQVSIDLPRAVLILAFIPGVFGVFMWCFEAKFMCATARLICEVNSKVEIALLWYINL